MKRPIQLSLGCNGVPQRLPWPFLPLPCFALPPLPLGVLARAWVLLLLLLLGEKLLGRRQRLGLGQLAGLRRLRRLHLGRGAGRTRLRFFLGEQSS